MQLAHRWLNRRLSLIEGVVAWILIALILGLFSRYVLEVFAKAEQKMLNTTVVNINTALNYQAAFHLLNNEYEKLVDLAMSNPMDNMQSISPFDGAIFENDELTLNDIKVSPPTNYAGEINNFTLPAMEKGKWYFNQDNRYLIYRISNTEFFSANVEGLEIVRFKIVIDYEDSNSNNRYEPVVDVFRMMKLQPVEQYQWNY